MKWIRLFTIVLFCSVASCKKDPGTVPTPTPQPPVTETFTYSSDRTRNLNVVYFIPTDVAVPADHHRRISS